MPQDGSFNALLNILSLQFDPVKWSAGIGRRLRMRAWSLWRWFCQLLAELVVRSQNIQRVKCRAFRELSIDMFNIEIRLKFHEIFALTKSVFFLFW